MCLSLNVACASEPVAEPYRGRFLSFRGIAPLQRPRQVSFALCLLGARVDALMNQRWQSGLSPFDGDCLVTDDLISVGDLCQLLGVILPELERASAPRTLYTFDDWHQHDGYVTQRRVIKWGELAALARTADALTASRQGDTYVHRSFYPEGFVFLIRYDVLDEESGDGSGFSGTFDLSAESEKIAQVASLVPVPLQSRLRVEPSKSYFDRTYRG